MKLKEQQRKANLKPMAAKANTCPCASSTSASYDMRPNSNYQSKSTHKPFYLSKAHNTNAKNYFMFLTADNTQ